MLEAWRHYVHGLCLQMDRPEVEKLRQEVLACARKVAEAAGGLWGFGDKASAAERTLLEKLDRRLPVLRQQGEEVSIDAVVAHH